MYHIRLSNALEEGNFVNNNTHMYVWNQFFVVEKIVWLHKEKLIKMWKSLPVNKSVNVYQSIKVDILHQSIKV